MDKKKLPILSTVLYVIAGLLVVYSIWAAVYSANYISTMMKQGQLVFSGNEFEIVSFYMSNVAQYVVFAITLFVLGRIVLYFSFIDSLFSGFSSHLRRTYQKGPIWNPG